MVAGTQRFYRGASLGTQDGVVGNGLMRSALTQTSPHQCFEEKSGPWCRLFSIRNILLRIRINCIKSYLYSIVSII